MAQQTFSGIVKLKTNMRGLDVVQSVYALAMALGLTDVFLGAKTLLTEMVFGQQHDETAKLWLVFMVFSNVVLLGLRFFWVPRNLADLVFRAAQCMKPEDVEAGRGLGVSNISFAFHLIVIFLHGAMFFLACAEFEYVSFLSSSSFPLNASLFTGYIVLHVSLLLLNSGWIYLIQEQERRIEQQTKALDDPPTPGNVWWLNNLLCSLVAIGPFAVLGTCTLAARCVAGDAGLASEIFNPGPLSPHQLSTVLQAIAGWLSRIAAVPMEASLWWALAVLAFNSLFDLCTTGQSYMFFRDVEWEHAQAASRVDPSAAP